MRNIFALAIFIFTHLASADRAIVDSFLGKPKADYIEKNETIQIKKMMQFEKGFSLRTSSADLVKLKLGQDFFITVFPESEIKVLGFELENNGYDIYEVIFVRGRFLVRNGSRTDQDLQIKYTSDFFSWISTAKSILKHFYFDLNMQSATARFCAGDFEMKVQLFDFETSQILAPSEGVSFQGVNEKGQIIFDDLLEGRKSPKGKWNEKYKCDLVQILKKAQQLENAEKAQAKKMAQSKNQFLKKQKEEYNKSLCHLPNGQLNQCHWKIEKSDCVRYRCNGQGIWAEKFILPTSQKKTCIDRKEANAVVVNCDY